MRSASTLLASIDEMRAAVSFACSQWPSSSCSRIFSSYAGRNEGYVTISFDSRSLADETASFASHQSAFPIIACPACQKGGVGRAEAHVNVRRANGQRFFKIVAGFAREDVAAAEEVHPPPDGEGVEGPVDGRGVGGLFAFFAR
jgi:hypothetical protein